MQLIINGENHDVRENITLQELLEELRIAEKVMACAVNMEIVKKDAWTTHSPKEGDKIELLHFVGGG